MRATAQMILAASGALCLSLPGCANAPAKLLLMNATELREVPLTDLCFAVGHLRKIHEPAPMVEAEFRRRGVSCRKTFSETVGDCSELSIENPYASPVSTPEGPMVYLNVRNTSAVEKTFRASWDNTTLSPALTIAANSTQSFAVRVQDRFAQASGGPAPSLPARPPHLQGCLTAWSPIPRGAQDPDL